MRISCNGTHCNNLFYTAEARRLYDVCIHEVVIKKNGAFIDGVPPPHTKDSGHAT